MTPPPEPVATAAPARAPSLAIRLLAKLQVYPVVGDVAEAVGRWWTMHPLRPALRTAGNVSAAAMGPVAQRHPIGLVLASAAAGALLLWARPWRWALRSAVFAGLVPQLASQVVRKLPIETWLAMLGTIVPSATRRRSPEQMPSQVAAPLGATTATVTPTAS